MKLQNLTVIFIIIILPIILLVSFYISTGLKTINYQMQYDTALLTATHDAIYAFEINSAKDKYSDNADAKREILKSSVKMFEKSLCNGCNISDYNKSEIEKYIPALVFGMYDGFYMYAPSYVASTGEYEHNLKNYVYYSEKFDDGTVITYTLDNYVIVLHKGQEIREGYLINRDALEITDDTITYNGVEIENKTDAQNYYKEADEFTKWFLSTNVNMQNKKLNNEKASYLNIGTGNDPEDQDSPFVQHKRLVIKEKIESVLNSSITVYSDKTLGYTYKMPKLSVEDWEKVYNNISMISFFQGKDIGFTKYNGYCVLNSTNSKEYVSPNLMYFIHNGEYHDIRCSTLKSLNDNTYIEGHKIGDFEKQYINDDMENETYNYKYSDLACYECINGQVDSSTSIMEYINDSQTIPSIKTSYWTSLAIERYNTTKVTNVSELRAVESLNIEVRWEDSYNGTPNFNGFRPKSITVGLFKNDDIEKFMDIEISEEKNKRDDNTWYIELDGLETYENNAEIIYKIYNNNISINGYEAISVSEEVETNTFIITCTDDPDIIYKTIIINWEDDNNNSKRTRSFVEVRLMISDEGIAKDYTVESELTDSWKKEISVRGYKEGEVLNWTAKLVDYPDTYNVNSETNSESYTFTLSCKHKWSDGICDHCGKNCEHDNYSDIGSNGHKCDSCNIIENHDYIEDGDKHKCNSCGHTHDRYKSINEREHGCSEICNLSGSHIWINKKKANECRECSVCGYKDTQHSMEGKRTANVCERCKDCGYETSHHYDEYGATCLICDRCRHQWKRYEADGNKCKMYCAYCDVFVGEQDHDYNWIGQCINCNHCKHLSKYYDKGDGNCCYIYCTECGALVGTQAHKYTGGRYSVCEYCGERQ